MGCGERRKRKCCRELFRPDLGKRTHQHYQLGVDLLWRPARLRARRAGSPSPRTEMTSATQCMSPEFQHGGRGHLGYWRKGRDVDPALQASQRRNSPVLLRKQTISRSIAVWWGCRYTMMTTPVDWRTRFSLHPGRRLP
jgi:hypothetical protein